MHLNLERSRNKGSHYSFLGHRSSQITTFSYDLQANKWHRSPCFRFDEICSSIRSCSLLLSFRNKIGKVKLDDVSELNLNNNKTSYYSAAIFTANIPLPNKSAPLNISARANKSYDLIILNKLLGRHV